MFVRNAPRVYVLHGVNNESLDYCEPGFKTVCKSRLMRGKLRCGLTVQLVVLLREEPRPFSNLSEVNKCCTCMTVLITAAGLQGGQPLVV